MSKINLYLMFIILFWTLLACEPVPFNISHEEKTDGVLMVNLVNDIRAKGCQCGSTYYPPVGNLVWNDLLASTALNHSKDMATKGYFAHQDKAGNTAEQRLDIAGYKWMSYGENLYQTTNPNDGVKEAVLAWKNSPGHCANLMKSNFNEMGFGVSKGYWTQLMGSR